ncbi:MAG: VOC family protein [Devosia marina]|jgi:catechol 2,3-dioxygenase-like lactoylglutathione lyase family enzyme|uniref:VOC family protein n=1 Tax=Devosia marina TaxID=2683198 RepID=UPI0032ED9C7F
MSTRPKPGVNRIVETAIYVDDIPSASAFYDTVFGFPALVRDNRVVAYDAGASTVFLLFKRGATLNEVVLAGGTIPPHDGSGPTHFCFAIDAEQLDDWESHLAELNIPVEARMNWDQGGKSLYFRDPDGHLIELGTPGIWRTY